ncbi:LytTR family DNA-binding domain-containing protein [Pedobacter sp. KR3-3]|uniref:LytTR family DNA-binding domain-containing protein n=1 Tax=Pedobacter albus TaxID=3113905 RepID=A0ABU7I2V4_9SPHI|nr:LytTR family DNA-binding domain-containing protein [Pedobacter sp. KR3-3]MEE1943802.1 LytTR family DNA-binding domain-containing protein [Pedobacter sp. KR3-3]
MYKCIIIDDEQHAIDGLKKYIDSVPELTLIQSYTDPLKALKSITEGEAVDLILMDVDMPKITGIELSKAIRSKTDKLIFTTAHTKYAYDAFEADADAFLLKPYTLGKFVITINKLFPGEKQGDAVMEKEDFFFVKSKEESPKIIKIKYKDVIAVESKLNYVMIHTATKNILTYMSLTEMAKILNNNDDFIQLHRSFIVRKDHMESIDGNTIKMINGVQITVGDHYRKEFTDFINVRLIKAGKKN